MQFRFITDTNSRGEPDVYTLDALAGRLHLELPTVRDSRRRFVRSEDSARGLIGWQRLYDQRVYAFKQLWGLRGGFHEGCRNKAAYYYALFLRGSLLDENTVWQELVHMGKACIPALKEKDIRSAFMESRKNRGQVRDSTISRHLNVTAEEGKMIPEWAPEIMSDGEIIMPDGACVDRGARKEVMRNILAELNRSPETISCRTMARLLQTRGIRVGHVQVSYDLREMKSSSSHPLTLKP